MPDRPKLPNIGDLSAGQIQKLLDQVFLKNPSLREYLEWAKYVPPGGANPEGMTHLLRLSNEKNDEVLVALRVDGPYNVILDLLLKAI